MYLLESSAWRANLIEASSSSFDYSLLASICSYKDPIWEGLLLIVGYGAGSFPGIWFVVLKPAGKSIIYGV